MLLTQVLLILFQIKRKFNPGLPLKIRQIDVWSSNTPLISVIIPCYNHGQYVGEAVQSILEQTWQNLEIIIVNDGSNEKRTTDVLEKFQRPKTRVLHLPQNMGLPAARNAGIKAARGKYICCLDADDRLHPTYIEKAIITMEVNSGISFIWAWNQVFGDEDRVWYTEQFDAYNMLFWPYLTAPAIFRKIAWETSGGFREEMREGFEDWEFWIRLIGNGFRGHRISEKLIFIRRIGQTFVHRALAIRDILFAKIKEYNPGLYTDPRSVINKIESGYCDIYNPSPFVNLRDLRNYLKLDTTPQMVISDLNSESTSILLKQKRFDLPLIWVAKQPMDEEALDLLYKTTPYVYIMPNFLPFYARHEFVRNLMKVWRIQSVQRLNRELS